MKRAVYIGPIRHLKGAAAIIDHRGLAQFDHMLWSRRGLLDDSRHNLLKRSLGFGWHKFPQEHWRITWSERP